MILCSGCFDGLHSGHVNYLCAAAGREDGRVVVAIAPDRYIRDTKGREPRWSQLQRARTVGALRCVAYTIEQPDSLAEVIRTFRPRYFTKGSEWKGKLPPDVVQACDDVGCQIDFVDTPGRHTSEAVRG